MIRTVLIAATVALTVAPALALASAQTRNAPQTPPRNPAAAATLPNAFADAPAAAPARPAPAPRAASPGAGASGAIQSSDPAVAAAAEAMLKTTIAAFQSGQPNYADMSPDLATRIRAQAATIVPLIQGFGPPSAIAHVGRENGAELFMVVFEKEATQWIISQDPQGKIRALLFRPAPSQAS